MVRGTDSAALSAFRGERIMSSRYQYVVIAVLSAILAMPLAGCGRGKKGGGDAYTEAAGYLRDEKWAEAVVALTKAVEEKPDEPARRFLLGKALVGNKAYEKAQAELNRVLTDLAGSTDSGMVELLAQAHFQMAEAEMGLAEKADAAKSSAQEIQAHYVAAEQHCRKALDKMPKLPDGYVTLARIFIARQESEKALAEIDKAIALDDCSVNAYRHKADLLYRLKNPGQALGACDAGISKLTQKRDKELAAISEKDEKKRKELEDAAKQRLNAGIFRLGNDKGFILSKQPGRTDEAITVYTGLLDVAVTPADRALVRNQLCLLYLDKREWDRAREEAKELMKLQGGVDRAAFIRGRAALGEASNDKLDDADRQKLLTTAINELSFMSGQQWAEGLFWLGQAYRYKGGRDEQALTEFRKALASIGSQHHSYLEVRILVGIADLLARNMDYKGAIEHCQKAIAILKSDVEAHQVLARIYQLTGQLSKAEDILEGIAGDSAPSSPGAAVEFAQLLLVRRQYDKAMEKCKQAIELTDGKDARAYYVLGLTHTALGQQHEAIAAFDKALGLDASLPQAYISLAQSYLATDQKPKAIELLKRCTAEQPGKPQPLVELAAIAEKDNDVDAAIQYYRDALARDPKYLPGYGIARLLLAKGQYDDAIQRWREAIAVTDETRIKIPSFQISLGHALMLAGKPDEAIKQIEDVKEQFPDRKVQYSIHEILIHLSSGQYAKAQEVLDNATDVSLNSKIPVAQFISLYKDNPVAGKSVLTPFVLAAVEMFENRPLHLEKAVGYLQQARRLMPASMLLLSNLSLVYVRIGQTEKLEEMANEMIKLDPQYATAYTYLGMLALSKKAQDDAALNFEKAVERDDRDVEARLMLARLRAQKEKYGDALKLIDQVLAIDPDNNTAYAIKMEIYARQDETGEVEKLANEILKNDAQSPLGRRAQVSVLIQKHKYDEAISVCDDALAFDPNDTSFYSYKAKALVKRNRPPKDNQPGDVDQAVTLLEKARQINDLNPVLYTELAAIYRSNLLTLPRAIYVLQEGLAKIPTSPAIVASLAETYMSTGKLDEAKELLAGIAASSESTNVAFFEHELKFYTARNQFQADLAKSNFEFYSPGGQADKHEFTAQIESAVSALRDMAKTGNTDQAFMARMIIGGIYLDVFRTHDGNRSRLAQNPGTEPFARQAASFAGRAAADARQAFDEAHRLKIDSEEPVNELVALYFIQSNFSDSSRNLETLCEKGANPLNYARLAISRQMEKRLDDAVKAARKAVDLLAEGKQESDATRIACANVLLDSGKIDDAVAAARAASKMDPERITGYEQLARNLDPKDRSAVVAEFNRGIFCLISGFNARVPEHYRAALDAASGGASGKNTNIFLMTALAESCLNAGQLDEASSVFQSILKLQPDYVKVWTYLGDVYQAQNKLTDAIEAYRQAVERSPKQAWIAANLGLLCHRLDKFSDAQKYYQMSLDVDANNPRVLHYLGETYEAQKLIEQALDCYNKVIKLAPNDRQSAAAYNNAAWNYATKKEPDLRTALGYALKARDLVPEVHAVRDTLGWIFYLSKDLKHAKDELKVAAAGMKDNGSVLYHYAQVLADLDEKEQAIAVLKPVDGLEFPEKAQAQELLAKLRGAKK